MLVVFTLHRDVTLRFPQHLKLHEGVAFILHNRQIPVPASNIYIESAAIDVLGAFFLVASSIASADKTKGWTLNYLGARYTICAPPCRPRFLGIFALLVHYFWRYGGVPSKFLCHCRSYGSKMKKPRRRNERNSNFFPMALGTKILAATIGFSDTRNRMKAFSITSDH